MADPTGYARGTTHGPNVFNFMVYFFLENIGLLALLGLGTHLKSLGPATYYVLSDILEKCLFNISKDYDLKYNNYHRGKMISNFGCCQKLKVPWIN